MSDEHPFDGRSFVPNVSAREFLNQMPAATGAPRRGPTGAVRDARVGKGRMDLVLAGWPRALQELAHHCEAGAARYGDRNWEYGQPMSWFIDSAGRHLLRLLAGHTDEDHLRAAAWNILGALETRERVEEGILPGILMDLELPLDVGAPALTDAVGDATPLPKWAAPYAADT